MSTMQPTVMSGGAPPGEQSLFSNSVDGMSPVGAGSHPQTSRFRSFSELKLAQSIQGVVPRYSTLKKKYKLEPYFRQHPQ